MQENAPAVRANYAKSVIASMKQPSNEREALLGRLDLRLRTAIRERGRLEWIPAADFAALATLVAGRLDTQALAATVQVDWDVPS